MITGAPLASSRVSSLASLPPRSLARAMPLGLPREVRGDPERHRQRGEPSRHRVEGRCALGIFRYFSHFLSERSERRKWKKRAERLVYNRRSARFFQFLVARFARSSKLYKRCGAIRNVIIDNGENRAVIASKGGVECGAGKVKAEQQNASSRDNIGT